MRQLAADNFNRANENPIGGNWTSGPGVAEDIQLLSNAVKAALDEVTNSVAFWNALAWPNDQWAEVTISTMPAGDNGPAVRIASAIGTYYFAPVFSDGRLEIYRSIDHTFTQLLAAGGAGTVVVGDRVRLEVQGTALRVYRNDALIGSTTDSEIASGSAGLLQDNTSGAMDDWAGGDFGDFAHRNIVLTRGVA